MIKQTMQLRSDAISEKEPSASYEVKVSEDVHNSKWDAFLADNPCGHHVQTSLWAQVKASLGWHAVRVIVTEGHQIVAGGQILFCRLPVIGKVGYVPKGPVLSSDNPDLADLVVRKLREVAENHRVQALLMQPPGNGDKLAEDLPRWGFRDFPVEMAPSATFLVDLAPSMDEILARMRKGTRYGIRRSKRDGISVREGTENDLAAFHRLSVATGQRRGFTPFAEDYFRVMWRTFSPHGYLKLFLSEYQGEAVSAQLVVTFGDTVIAKHFGWSGQHARLRPNEALDWATIKWAKSNGYRYYDLEGIDRKAAEAILRGEQLPNESKLSPTFYKIGFGGETRLLPGTYCYIFTPLLRVAYMSTFHIFWKWFLTENTLSLFRTRRKRVLIS